MGTGGRGGRCTVEDVGWTCTGERAGEGDISPVEVEEVGAVQCVGPIEWADDGVGGGPVGKLDRGREGGPVWVLDHGGEAGPCNIPEILGLKISCQNS